MLLIERLIHQVVTVLKDTTKLVTEVPFPALTLCGSGLHMNNVEKKLVQDFRNWRTQYKKTNTSREAIEKDMKEFMEERFQIKSSDQPINILDILDMMIAPDVDASIAANGVRENEISCKQSTGGVDDNTGCTKSCSDSRFDLTMGDNCLYLSTKAASQPEAVAACKSMGAELATITKNDQGWIKSKTERDAGVWIGLNDIEKEGTWVWQDGSSSATYTNWLTTNPRQPDGDGDCLIVLHISDAERWSDIACDKKYRYACSMEPEECSSEVLTKMLQKRTCIKPEKNNSTQDQSSNLPAIDIFLNPAKEQAKEKLIKEKKEIAKNYFKESDMKTFYPELFRILWESTLPCFEEENKEEHMLLSCELAKVEVNCSDIFTRVPTDIGMCCALNVDDSLRDSEYQTLVKEMQGEKTTLRVKSQEGSRNGLRLTLDLHSYSVSLGTLDQQHNTFKMFVGEPAQFPMMLDKSFPLQPGREHFVDLCATLVTTNGIKHISPEDRGCLFTDESDLDFYKGYTFTNCRLECGIKEAEKEHNCIPWHLPKVGLVYLQKEIIHLQKGKHSSTCNPWTARDFMEDMRKHSAQCQQCLSGIDNDMILDQFDCDHVHICEIMCSMTTPRLCPHLLLIDSYGG